MMEIRFRRSSSNENKQASRTLVEIRRVLFLLFIVAGKDGIRIADSRCFTLAVPPSSSSSSVVV
jgi:hypothetical protein